MYGLSVSLIMLCEGGHFTLLPNEMRKIYGPKSTSLYGIAYSYTGLTAIMILILQNIFLDSDSAASYNAFFYTCGSMSLVALILLLTVFTDEKFVPKE